ncbi:DMT family transporter [Pontivivens insulae]|uniref:Riboflavin transporter n=1 Tax=Pontivivens insulae TaxID=1639689 RepID=A0A2R8A8W4_9RHOB|nr:DMT family transporter [Pontivivens insulae]RED18761.1 drug/metabolite transporter (DMT)-like permease [Pontivivens insulae]SPF28659.1 Riboflavin transporter [Pontivivens insulae]
MTAPIKGALAALMSFAFFSSHDALVKSLGGAISVFQIVFFSVLFGFPLVMLMLIRDRAEGTLRPRHPWLVGLRTLLAVTTSFGAFYAFTSLPLSQVYSIIFAQPLLITALSVPLLGESVGWRRWIAVLVGLIGVMIVLDPRNADLQWGHLAALIAAFGGAVVSIILRKIGGEERSAVLILYPMLANFACMGLALPFVYVAPSGVQLATLAAIALFSFGGMLMMILAYRIAPAAIVAPMQYSQIIWAALLGALFFMEFPTWNTAVGAGVIIAAGLYIVARERSGGRSQTTPVSGSRTPRGDTAPGLRAGDVLRMRDAANRPLRSDPE